MKWLFLVHQIQSPHSREKVRVWRLIRKSGAVLYRNSVYVVPFSRENLERLQWMCQEINDSKGEGSFFIAEPGDKKEDAVLRQIYNRSREQEFKKVEGMVREIEKKVRGAKSDRTTNRHDRSSVPNRNEIDKIEGLFHEIAATDFFKIPSGVRLKQMIERVKKEFNTKKAKTAGVQIKTYRRSAFRNRKWGTREHIHIDRLCSAWLIKRFIDPGARFVFSPENNLPADAIPFDVFGVEFSHRGDDCTFETLLRAFQIKDQALTLIAELVHDIDLRDDKFGRPEASGLDLIVRSLSGSLKNDHKVLELGSTLLDSLYERFHSSKHG